GRAGTYDCHADYCHSLVRPVRSEAADIRCKSYRTVGLQSNNYGRQFEINRRGLKQWPTASRVTLATSYCYAPRSSESEVTGPTCVSKLARVERPAFGRRLQQSPRLSVPFAHRTKPFGGMRRNLTTDSSTLARGSRGGLAAMSDETYASLLVWIICALLFSCGVVAIGQHPGWFCG